MAGLFVFLKNLKESPIPWPLPWRRFPEGGSTLVPHIPKILRACTLLLLIVVAARPQLYNVSRDVRSPGVDIMLCLDTSGSMQALDFKVEGKSVTRLEAVKKVVAEFHR